MKSAEMHYYMSDLDIEKAHHVLSRYLVDGQDPCHLKFGSRSTFSRVCKKVKGNYCRRCGWRKASCDAHHIIPLSQGGANTICNCEVLCPNCHRIKHTSRKDFSNPNYRPEDWQI